MSHGLGFPRSIVQGVLTQLSECLTELLLQGQPVKLDGFGTFKLTADTVEGGIAPAVAEASGFNPVDYLDGLHQAEETMHIKEHETERIHFHDQFIMNIYMDNFKLYDWMRLEDSLRNMDKQMQLKDSTMLTDYISAEESMKMAEHSSERVKFRDRMYMEIEEDDKIFKDHFHQIRDLLKQIDAQFIVKEQEMLTDDPTVTNATLTIHDRKDEKPV